VQIGGIKGIEEIEEMIETGTIETGTIGIEMIGIETKETDMVEIETTGEFEKEMIKIKITRAADTKILTEGEMIEITRIKVDIRGAKGDKEMNKDKEDQGDIMNKKTKEEMNLIIEDKREDKREERTEKDKGRLGDRTEKNTRKDNSQSKGT
jgi:hypothetical protein